MPASATSPAEVVTRSNPRKKSVCRPRLPSRLVPLAAALALGLLAAGSPALAAQAPVPGHSSSTLRVGDVIPSFRAVDQFGRRRDFANLDGTKGLVILFFRSADW